MLKKFIRFVPILALTACAFAVDGAVQEIKFITPGAENAHCKIDVNGLKYSVHPPNTINIYKNKADMEVDCRAPGNRRKVIYVEADYEKSALYNVANGGAGIPWDYASNALFKYPDIIEINFTDAPVRSEPLPAQNQPDIRQPEDYPLEEFLPGSPRLNSDKNKAPTEIRLRQKPGAGFYEESTSTNGITEAAEGGGKGDLMNVMDGSMEDAMNPAGDPSEPIQLYPGQ